MSKHTMTLAEELENSTGSTGASRQTASIMKGRRGVVEKLAAYLEEDEHLGMAQRTGLLWDYVHALLIQGMIPKSCVV